ncbi:MAG TPA: radical SAM protein [Candidatus Polarisedimenticolia bacterium]|nr:radical SAM protein [Candidatus Polarisedimenticolia bacterium]
MSYELGARLKEILLRTAPAFMADRWQAPRVLTFMMTYRCNLRCTMCWQWGEQGLFHEMPREHELQQLDLATLRAVVDDVAAEGTGVFLWGGEPFLHRDLLPFVEHVKSLGMYCSINTNGTYLPRDARRLVDLGVDAIMVSVDGPREVHDRIRGMDGSFQKIADGLKAVRAARNGGAKPEIVVNTTVSPGNQDVLLKTYETVEALGADRMILSQLWFTTEEIGRANEAYFREKFSAHAGSWKGFVMDVSSLDPDLIGSQMREMARRDKSLPLSFLPDLHPGQIAAYYRKPSEAFGKTRCLVPWLEAEILPNGDVTPCSDRPDLIMGNVRRQRFGEIWNNEPYQTFRRAMREDGLFPYCSRCCGLWSH